MNVEIKIRDSGTSILLYLILLILSRIIGLGFSVPSVVKIIQVRGIFQ